MSTKQWKQKNIKKMRAYRRKWYAANKAHAIFKIKERRRALRKWLKEYKATLACVRCGEDFPACLEFHHTNPKKKTNVITGLVQSGCSIKTIKTEIAKCIVLCANCHRKHHYK